MLASVDEQLKDARRNLRRARKQDLYRTKFPLSAAKLQQALAVWWEAGREMQMALRYLTMQHRSMAKRLGLQPHAEGDLSVGAARPAGIPEEWRTKLDSRVASLVEADLDGLRHPSGTAIRRKEAAKKFLMDMALVAYVEQQNCCGHTVSSRAVLERKALLLESVAGQSHTQLLPLPRRAKKWVGRWQRRHGVSRGRFRVGAGLSEAQKRVKALGDDRAKPLSHHWIAVSRFATAADLSVCICEVRPIPSLICSRILVALQHLPCFSTASSPCPSPPRIARPLSLRLLSRVACVRTVCISARV